MIAWQILSILGLAFLILEIFTPSMFFLNFALAAFITAIFSLYVTKLFYLVLIFFVFSFLSFIFLRPIIMKKSSRNTNTGLDAKYIDKIIKTKEDISESSGVIYIYDERWDARSIDGSLIPAGSDVKIIKNEGIVMYVDRVDK